MKSSAVCASARVLASVFKRPWRTRSRHHLRWRRSSSFRSCARAAARLEISEGGSPRRPMYLSASFFIASLWVTVSTSGLKFFVLLVETHQLDCRDQARISGYLDDLFISRIPQAEISAVDHDVPTFEADRYVALGGSLFSWPHHRRGIEPFAAVEARRFNVPRGDHFKTPRRRLAPNPPAEPLAWAGYARTRAAACQSNRRRSFHRGERRREC